jgi:hypothetical protein
MTAFAPDARSILADGHATDIDIDIDIDIQSSAQVSAARPWPGRCVRPACRSSSLAQPERVMA